jgi:excisionase family DNA binding protein
MVTITSDLNTDLLTINQAKRYLKCSRVFLWKLRKDNKIHSVNAGKKVLIQKASIDAYLHLNQKEVENA